ncbi:hypothetical protein [Paraburkholderia sp. HD33-4]|uniref:hypothetical protein n=1 Tax=Paraburkholderia sp. HD33-4 TaxID=2883242 RepID=UPI001F2A9378|nr:hypothetical protein [Paraburkholderia sp. HD33-4]
MTVRNQMNHGVSPLHLWGVWLIATIVASVPFLTTSVPPLGQHFYNIVRVDILSHPASYVRNFVVQWDVLPDLAMDLAVPWFTKFIPVEWATWLFTLVELGLLTSGCLVLSRVANGRWSWLPFISFLLLYNWILIRGYDNFLFGLGVCFWAIAAHVALRRSTLVRILVSCGSALVIYFCHLFPLAVFALITGTWELGCFIRERKFSIHALARHAAASIIPLLLPFALLVHSSTGGLHGATNFGLFRVLSKIAYCVDVLSVGNRVADVAIVAGLVVFVVTGLVQRWWTCEPEFRITVFALPLVVLLAPFDAFASYGVIERCGLSFAFLLTALVGIQPSVAPRLQRIGALVLTLVFVLRIATVTEDWRGGRPVIQAYRSTFASLKAGSVLFQYKQDTAYPSPWKDPHRWNPYLDKVVALATVDGVLVPDLYLKAGQQPVLYRSENVALRQFQDESSNRDPDFEANGAMLRAWSTALLDRFPDLQSRFTAVYLAVFDPYRRLPETLDGWQLVATLPEHRLYELRPR